MAMVEQDLEQLEQYLDGALDTHAVSLLFDRLKSDPELTAGLADLKAQRAVRLAVWQSIEPDAGAADRLLWRIRGAMLNQQQNAIASKTRWSSWRIASLGSAAAACLVLGFMFGRIGHSSNAAPPVAVSTDIAFNNTLHSGELKRLDPSPAPAAVITANNDTKLSVPITNEYGQVVAWQTFNNAEQAKNFTEDLHRTHAQPAAPAAGGQTRLVDQQQQVPF